MVSPSDRFGRNFSCQLDKNKFPYPLGQIPNVTTPSAPITIEWTGIYWQPTQKKCAHDR